MRLDARDVGGVPVRCRRRPPGPDLVDAEGFAASSTVTRATLGAASPVGVDELAYVAARLVERLAAVPRGGHNRRVDVRVRAENPVRVLFGHDVEQRGGTSSSSFRDTR